MLLVKATTDAPPRRRDWGYGQLDWGPGPGSMDNGLMTSQPRYDECSQGMGDCQWTRNASFNAGSLNTVHEQCSISYRRIGQLSLTYFAESFT